MKMHRCAAARGSGGGAGGGIARFRPRTIRRDWCVCVVPQAAGGGTDTFARANGQKLSERWGQPVVIENKAGAGGVVGTDFVAKSAPDGYTLLVTYEGSQAINQSLYEKLPFDSLKDFYPVATIAVTPFILIVGPRAEARTLQQFIAFARANPDRLSYGSAGNGSVNHLLGEMLKTEAGIHLVHVPYKGASAAIADVIGGHIDAAFASVPSVISSVQSNVVRALAVSSANRIAMAPDIPTIAEAGGFPKFDVDPWWGILAPAGLSPSIARKISADIAEILKTPEMQRSAGKAGRHAPDQLTRCIPRPSGAGYREVEKGGKGVRSDDQLASHSPSAPSAGSPRGSPAWRNR